MIFTIKRNKAVMGIALMAMLLSPSLVTVEAQHLQHHDHDRENGGENGGKDHARSLQPVLMTTAQIADEQNKLDQAKSKWASRGYQNYEYALGRTCGNCASLNYPWRVQVYIGVTRAVDSKLNVGYNPPNVNTHFDTIQRAINDPTLGVTGVYDDTLGYPTRYNIVNANTPSDPADVWSLSLMAQDLGTPEQLYQTNYLKWQQGRAVSYDFSYQEKGNPAYIRWPLRVKVRNNILTSVVDADGNPVNFLTPETVDQTFATIKRVLDNNSPFLDVEYNSKLGYPTEVFIVANTPSATTQYYERFYAGFQFLNLT